MSGRLKARPYARTGLLIRAVHIRLPKVRIPPLYAGFLTLSR